MKEKRSWSIGLILCCLSLVLASPTIGKGADKPFVFGMLLVGPYNDRGWSQAHYEAGRYVEEKVPGAKMIYIDKVNPADRPGITIPQLVDDLVSKGARLIIANSDDMKDGTREAALLHPDTSNVGFLPGKALSHIARSALDKFIGDLGANKVRLFKGPLYYQEGTVFVKAGRVATDRQIWYMEQLLEGMKGQSKAK
ncbi:MAG: hypothetical protein JRJ03_13450 [Deltaproteobacteria bacterium]|nr:hypothetical protein [Deltaproteobacteria bacterium]